MVEKHEHRYIAYLIAYLKFGNFLSIMLLPEIPELTKATKGRLSLNTYHQNIPVKLQYTFNHIILLNQLPLQIMPLIH